MQRYWGGIVYGAEKYKNSAEDYIFVSGRTVYISDLWVSDHEVTQEEYERFCFYSEENAPNEAYGKNPALPAYNVSWFDAVMYCNFLSIEENLTPVYSINGKTHPCCWPESMENAEGLYRAPDLPSDEWGDIVFNTIATGYRLPTEAEWEYLARGGSNGLPSMQAEFPGSDDASKVSWYEENSDSRPHISAQKKENSLYLYDMGGNVNEWCWDWYARIIPTSGSYGPDAGSKRVLRGGSWNSTKELCQVSARQSASPVTRSTETGFRVVRTLFELRSDKSTSDTKGSFSGSDGGSEPGGSCCSGSDSGDGADE